MRISTIRIRWKAGCEEYLEKQDVLPRIHCNNVSLYFPVWIIFLDRPEFSVYYRSQRRKVWRSQSSLTRMLQTEQIKRNRERTEKHETKYPEVKYVSADEAWKNFQKDYFGDNAESGRGI